MKVKFCMYSGLFFFFFPTRLCAFVCRVKNDGKSHLILGAFRDTSVCEYTTEPLCHL